MSKQDVKDFADRLKGELAKRYNKHRDKAESFREGNDIPMAAVHTGKACEVREVMQIVDQLLKEV